MSLLSILSTNSNKDQAANGKKRKWIISAVILAVVVAAFCVWKSFQPRHLAVVLIEQSEKADQLPSPKQFIATLYLGNEVRRDTIKSFGNEAYFGEIDKTYADKKVRLTIQGDHYLTIDTTFVLTAGTLKIGMQRNAEEYGRIRFHLWDPYKGEMIPGCKMKVGPMDVTTGSQGEVDILIPLSQQAKQYNLSAEVPLADSIFVMPCTEDHFVCVHPSMAKEAKKAIQEELHDIIEHDAKLRR